MIFIILSASAIFVRFINLIIRILISRISGEEILGMYLMILPTLSFLLNLTQAGIPTSLFTLTSHSKYNHKKLMITCFKLITIQMLICFIIVYTLRFHLRTIFPYLIYIFLFIIIANISSLFRSYYLGIKQPIKTSIAQIIEEFSRIFTLTLLYFITHNITIQHLFSSMIIGELLGCLYLWIHLHFSKKNITKSPLYKPILSISIPTSISQITHSFTHFLEPLLYKKILLKKDINLTSIHQSYGMINGQVLSLLMIPSFLNNTIYKLLLPRIDLHNNKKTQKLMTQSLLLCLLIGLPSSIAFYYFPDFLLSFLYNSTQGSMYLKYIAFPFMIFYIQTPLQAYLQAHMKNKILFIFSTLESITSITLLLIYVPLFEETGLIISFLGSLLIYTLCCFLYVFYDLFFQKK